MMYMSQNFVSGLMHAELEYEYVHEKACYLTLTQLTSFICEAVRNDVEPVYVDLG